MIALILVVTHFYAFTLGGIVMYHIKKRQGTLPVTEENKPYDCYWSRRALNAEKSLREKGLL